MSQNKAVPAPDLYPHTRGKEKKNRKDTRFTGQEEGKEFPATQPSTEMTNQDDTLARISMSGHTQEGVKEMFAQMQTQMQEQMEGRMQKQMENFQMMIAGLGLNNPQQKSHGMKDLANSNPQNDPPHGEGLSTGSDGTVYARTALSGSTTPSVGALEPPKPRMQIPDMKEADSLHYPPINRNVMINGVPPPESKPEGDKEAITQWLRDHDEYMQRCRVQGLTHPLTLMQSLSPEDKEFFLCRLHNWAEAVAEHSVNAGREEEWVSRVKNAWKMRRNHSLPETLCDYLDLHITDAVIKSGVACYLSGGRNAVEGSTTVDTNAFCSLVDTVFTRLAKQQDPMALSELSTWIEREFMKKFSFRIHDFYKRMREDSSLRARVYSSVEGKIMKQVSRPDDVRRAMESAMKSLARVDRDGKLCALNVSYMNHVEILVEAIQMRRDFVSLAYLTKGEKAQGNTRRVEQSGTTVEETVEETDTPDNIPNSNKRKPRRDRRRKANKTQESKDTGEKDSKPKGGGGNKSDDEDDESRTTAPKVKGGEVKRLATTIPGTPGGKDEYHAAVKWWQPGHSGSLHTLVCGDTGADRSIFAISLEKIRESIPDVEVEATSPVWYTYGSAEYEVRKCIRFSGIFLIDGRKILLKKVEFGLPEYWPKEEILIGKDFLRKIGSDNPLSTIAVDSLKTGMGIKNMTTLALRKHSQQRLGKMFHEDMPVDFGYQMMLATAPGIRRIRRVATQNEYVMLEDSLPFATNQGPDELDEATSPPPVGDEEERPETDPELKEAVDELIMRSLDDLELALDKIPLREKESREEIIERTRSLFERYRYTAFRTKFYETDKACKVTPWVDPVVPSLERPTMQKAHRRQYPPMAKEFMRKLTARLVKCGLVEYMGPLSSPVEAYAIAHAVVAPKRGAGEFRLAFDQRAANQIVEYYGFPVPATAELEDIFENKRLFLSFDVSKAFWQLPLDPRSQSLYILATADDLFRSRRVIQGGKNSTAAMSCAVKQVFGNLIRDNKLALYVDDGTGGSNDYPGLLDLLGQVLERCAKFRLYLNPKKMRLFQTELSFLGKIVRNGAIHPDPEMTQGIIDLAPPKTVADIMTFCGMVQWLSTHLPQLSKLLSPLHLLESFLLQGSRSRSKKYAAKITLEGHWTPEHQTAFEDVKRLLAHASENYLPRKEDSLALFTDASRIGWSGVLLAYPETEEEFAVTGRSYRSVAWVSSMFKGPEINYSVPEKETLAAVNSMKKLEMKLYGKKPFTLYVDHQNMAKCWALGRPSPTDTNHVVAGRVQRWAAWMSRFNARVAHIPGESNLAADYGSRNFLCPTQEVIRRVEGGPEVPQNAPMHAFGNATLEEQSKGDLVYPDLGEILEAQTKAMSEESPTDTLEFGHPGDGQTLKKINSKTVSRYSPDDPWMIITEEKSQKSMRIWIPQEATSLQVRIIVIAHTALGGHQGIGATTKEICHQFYWKGLRTSVEDLISGCLNCWSAHRPGEFKRPLYATYVAQHPGECLQADFVKMFDPKRLKLKGGSGRPAENVYPYLLVLKCKMSRFTMLFPCEDCTAASAARSVMKWICVMGIPKIFYSDGGPHFTGGVMKELTVATRMERYATIPYAPQTNGSVERAGGVVIRICQSLCSENELPDEEWHTVLPLVQYRMNSKEMKCLGGMSPIGLMTGRRPVLPLDAIVGELNVPPTVRALMTQSLNEETLEELMDELADRTKTVVNASSDVLQQDRDRRNDQPGRNHSNLQVQMGDYVMAHRANPPLSKLTRGWDGPHQVIEALGDNSYKIKDLVLNRMRTEHASKLARYRDGQVTVTDDMRRRAAHARHGLVISRIDKHRFMDNTAEVRFVWKGLEGASDLINRYSDIGYAMKVVPDLVRNYVARFLTSTSKEQKKTGRALVEMAGLTVDQLGNILPV